MWGTLWGRADWRERGTDPCPGGTPDAVGMRRGVLSLLRQFSPGCPLGVGGVGFTEEVMSEGSAKWGQEEVDLKPEVPHRAVLTRRR